MHRDIKPDNIYYDNNKACFGDFGLVEFPDNKNNFTRENKGLGAIFTIAPEMKRNPKCADGKKADVFSLAKTLWILLTKNIKGFDGMYDCLDRTHGLRFVSTCKSAHLAELEDLLKDATNNTPEQRPTIEEFKERLKLWIEISADPFKAQSSEWNFIQNLLLGSNPPESSKWRNPVQIVRALNIIGLTPIFALFLRLLCIDGCALGSLLGCIPQSFRSFLALRSMGGCRYLLANG